MEFKNFNDEEASQNGHYDDDFDNDKIPSFNHSFVEDEGRVLTLNIGKDAGSHSKKYFLEILENCWGMLPIKIQIKDYTDGIKASISGAREKLEDDPEVNILSETEGQDQDLDDVSDTLSAVSSKSTWLAPKLVQFEKTSDLIILHSLSFFWNKLKNCAASNQVILDYSDKGILIKGENEDGFNKVENMIKKMYNDIICYKDFKNLTSDKINIISNALKNVNESLAKKFNLEFVHTITSEAYYQTYSDLARKIPALAFKLQRKTQKPSLRLILSQKNIRNKPEIVTKFRDSLKNNCSQLIEKLEIESSEPLKKKEFAEIMDIANQYKLHISHEVKKIVDNDTLKIRDVHQFIMISYYSSENEKIILQKRVAMLKGQINKIMRPSLLYYFTYPEDKAKYLKFVFPEIEKDLKENNIKVTMITKDIKQFPQPGQRPYFKPPQQSNFALNIQGEKTKIQRLRKKIVELMTKINTDTYCPKLAEFVSKNLRVLANIENEQFFLNFFNEVYSECPDVMLKHYVRTKKVPQNNDNQQKNSPEKTPGAGAEVGGEAPKNEKPNKAPKWPYEIKELVIQIFYKNKEGLNQAKAILDKFFENLVAERIFLQKWFSELLLGAGTKKEDFQKQYNVLTNELFDKYNNKIKVDLIGQKENVVNAKDYIMNLNNAVKIISDKINIESRLLQSALKPELRKLAPEVMCDNFFKSVLTLYGEPSKVQKAKNNIITFLNTKKSECHQIKIENIPNSYLKAIEKKTPWYFDLQKNNQVNVRLIKPSSTKLHTQAGIENKVGKSLLVVKGDISKIHVDAIVHCADLKFGAATENEIVNKAGAEYEEECKKCGELKEGEIFTSSSGNLENCKSIINVSPPLHNDNSDLDVSLNKLKVCVLNIIKEANQCNFESIALPFISNGKNHSIPSQEAIIRIIEEFADALFLQTSSSRLKKIVLVETDEAKLHIAEQKINSIVPNNQANGHVVQYQWQYEADDHVWTDYDLQINRQIDYAFTQGQNVVEINFPGSTLNEPHVIDFTRMIRTEKQTNVIRKIQKAPLTKNQLAHKFVIPYVNLVQQGSLIQGKVFGEILIEGFSIEKIEKVQKEIQQFLDGLMCHIEIEISPKIEEGNLLYLMTKIQRNGIKVTSGELKEGRRVKLYGIKSAILKIDERVRTFNRFLGESQIIPENWTKMTEDFAIVPLSAQDNEWNFVLQKFNQTLSGRSIISVQRIQNAKFWRQYCQEKKELGKMHEKAGFSSDIKEEFLWHGTGREDPSVIYAAIDVCFDTQQAYDGLWGRGIYFAVNANYADGRATVTSAGSKLFMLCRVMIGDTIELKSNPSLRIPPERPNAKETILYDSIKGNSGGSDIYIIYRTRRAYPEYLIEYK